MQAGERKVLGDATDAGLLRFCDKIMQVDDVRASFESVFSIPFNSRNKWALNMVRIPGDADNYLVLIKGAPDYVIKKCGRYSYRDGEQVMDDQYLGDVMDSNEGYASMAERVIGHAYKVRATGTQFVILKGFHVGVVVAIVGCTVLSRSGPEAWKIAFMSTHTGYCGLFQAPQYG